MNDAYFWYNQMPALSTLDVTLNPTDFFEKLIYQRATVDRFSDITDDINGLEDEFNGVTTAFGINFVLIYTDNTQTNVGVFLSSVIKGSPADAAGLKRGDFIMKINGQQVNATNYQTLLSTGDTQTFYPWSSC